MSKSKPDLLRVTQMNALYLDREILRLFQELAQNTCKHLPLGFISSIDSEVNLLVRLAILKYTLFDQNTTAGQQLLNIKYENLTATKKIIYLVFNIFPYIKSRCELTWPSHEINITIFKVYVALKVLDLLNLSVFLRTGEKPQLIERVLGLRHVYQSDEVQRTFQSKYLARELLWNGFIGAKATSETVKPEMTIQTRCAHCGHPPVLPHHMGCSHVFCYVCLKGNVVTDDKYECPSCGLRNNGHVKCEPVHVN